MTKETLSEEAQLTALRNGEVIDVTNNTTQVINTEAPVVENTETVVTEPVVETPVVEKPYWEEKGFTSQTELDEFIEKGKSTPKATYANEYAERLDTFTKITGKKDVAHFDFYEKTEIKENMDPKEYVKLIVEKEILEQPELAKFKAMRQEELEKEYLLDIDETEEGISERDLYNKKMKELQLKKDASAIITDITQTREKIANNGLTAQEVEEGKVKFEQAKVKSAEFITKEVESLNLDIYDQKKNDKGEIEILLDGEKKPVIIKSFTFEQEEKDFYKNALEGVITQMGFPEPDSDNAKLAVKLAKMATKDQFELKRTKEVIAQTEARMIKKHNLEVDNPSTKKVAEISTNTEKILSEEEALREARKGG